MHLLLCDIESLPLSCGVLFLPNIVRKNNPLIVFLFGIVPEMKRHLVPLKSLSEETIFFISLVT